MSAMRNRTMEPVPSFAEALERLRGEAAGSSGRALEQRNAAFERFQALGVPTPRVESWKYTNAASARGCFAWCARRELKC